MLIPPFFESHSVRSFETFKATFPPSKSDFSLCSREAEEVCQEIETKSQNSALGQGRECLKADQELVAPRLICSSSHPSGKEETLRCMVLPALPNREETQQFTTREIGPWGGHG